MTRQYALTTIEAFADKDWFNMHSYNELRAMFKVVRSAYKRYPKLSSNIGKQRLVYWLLTFLGRDATCPYYELDGKYFAILSHAQKISLLTYWLHSALISNADYNIGLISEGAACDVRNKYYQANTDIIAGSASTSAAIETTLANGFKTNKLPRRLKTHISGDGASQYKTYWAKYVLGLTDYIHPSINYRITNITDDKPVEVASTLAYLYVLNVLTPEEYDYCSDCLTHDSKRSWIVTVVKKAIIRTRAYDND